jgi:hypothetical protein
MMLRPMFDASDDPIADLVEAGQRQRVLEKADRALRDIEQMQQRLANGETLNAKDHRRLKAISDENDRVLKR